MQKPFLIFVPMSLNYFHEDCLHKKSDSPILVIAESRLLGSGFDLTVIITHYSIISIVNTPKLPAKATCAAPLIDAFHSQRR